MAFYNDIEDITNNTVDGWIEGDVFVNLFDVAEMGLDGFLDFLSEGLIGSDLLMDISIVPIGVESDGLVRVRVKGDPTAHIDTEIDYVSWVLAHE